MLPFIDWKGQFMSSTQSSGRGYRFLPGVRQYSGGVVADRGHAMHRWTLDRALPLAEGFDVIDEHLVRNGLSSQAVCALELRSPEPSSEQGFADLNTTYLGLLDARGLLMGDVNPIARTNVCPSKSSVTAPSIFAVSYVRPTRESDARGTFVVSGSAEVPEGLDSYAEHAIAAGDCSAAGLVAKTEWVVDEMERRLHALGGRWSTCSEINAYTVEDTGPPASVLDRRLPHGVLGTWWQAAPPVTGLAFEMDCRSVLSAVGPQSGESER